MTKSFTYTSEQTIPAMTMIRTAGQRDSGVKAFVGNVAGNTREDMVHAIESVAAALKAGQLDFNPKMVIIVENGQ